MAEDPQLLEGLAIHVLSREEAIKSRKTAQAEDLCADIHRVFGPSWVPTVLHSQDMNEIEEEE